MPEVKFLSPKFLAERLCETLWPCDLVAKTKSEVLSPADSADFRRMRMKPFDFGDVRRC
jgi:hypothetical protein